MIKEDPIKLEKKRTWKRCRIMKIMWRSIGLLTPHNERSTCLSTTHNREGSICQQKASIVNILAHMLTCAQICQQPETQNQIQVSFSGAFRFFSGGLQIELKFYSLKNLFINIEGFRIILGQENQLL